MLKLFRESFVAISLLVILIFFFVTVTKAAQTADVTATVTAEGLSVTITSDGVVPYLTLAAAAREDTTTGGINDTQTAFNAGNVVEDFNIQGQDSTGSGAGWTLASTTGADQYFHEWCITTCDASPSWTATTTGYTTLSTGIATSATQDFDLRIGVPSTTTDYSQQSVDITIQAVAN